jgi:hypothetical protein
LISECSEKISGEHLVSKCLFPRGVNVQGFRWCLDETQSVGVNALRAKVLCERHNSNLSELDAAALDVWCVLREAFERVDEKRRLIDAGVKPEFLSKRYRLDGTRFERWCFKTMINMIASGSVRGFSDDWEPGIGLARYVVDGSSLPEGCGLGMIAGVGDMLLDQNQIQFQAIRGLDPANTRRPEVAGFLLGFRGLRMAGSSILPLLSLPVTPAFAGGQKIRRLGLLKLENVNAHVAFDWTGLHRNDTNEDVVLARR